MSFWQAVVILVLVMDPLGNIPPFTIALARVPGRRRLVVLIRELLLALGVLVVGMVVGKPLLDILQLSQDALTISGGVILFLIALRMVFPPTAAPAEEDPDSEPFIVPLAVPLVAGPSALAVVILMAARDPHHLAKWLLALLAAWAATALCLLFCGPLGRFLGSRGLTAVERLMGLLLTTMAVQMFLNGVGALLGR